ncbi:hypothetical protein B0H11DRAFT_1933692 [Mycena galericulata]|nr:hypothetical protein B0H11DRAFT_1933692 [Mycena galericulata]
MAGNMKGEEKVTPPQWRLLNKGGKSSGMKGGRKEYWRAVRAEKPGIGSRQHRMERSLCVWDIITSLGYSVKYASAQGESTYEPFLTILRTFETSTASRGGGVDNIEADFKEDPARETTESMIMTSMCVAHFGENYTSQRSPAWERQNRVIEAEEVMAWEMPSLDRSDTTGRACCFLCASISFPNIWPSSVLLVDSTSYGRLVLSLP